MEHQRFPPNESIPTAPTTASASLSLLPMLIPVFCLALSYLTWKDYRAFISLGRGGVPWNFYGYLFITAHRPLTLRSVFLYPTVPTHLSNKGHLTQSNLPARAGIRPIVKGIIPQRQITQQGTPTTFALTHAALSALAAAYPKECLAAGSRRELHSKGLHSLVDSSGKPTSRALCRESEICHVHAFDGSIHVELHPEDAKIVIDKGWGERHPLANGWEPMGKFLAEGFMIIYAPRNLEEIETVMRIVGAGIGWKSGGANGWVERAAKCAREVVVEKESAGKTMEDWADLEKERLRVMA